MKVDNKEMIMRVSPFTAASATAAFLITIIAGAGQAQTAMDALKNKPGSVGLQPRRDWLRGAATPAAASLGPPLRVGPRLPKVNAPP